MGRSEGDAALSGAEGSGGDVQEDGGAAVRNCGGDVPVEDADDVVEVVAPVELFVPGRVRDLDMAIVGKVVWVVAPGIVRADRLDGDGGGRWLFAIGTIEDAQQFEGASWGGLVALGFMGGHASRAAGGGEL